MKPKDNNLSPSEKQCYQYKVRSVYTKKHLDNDDVAKESTKNVEWQAVYDRPVEEFIYPSLRLPLLEPNIDYNSVSATQTHPQVWGQGHASTVPQLREDVAWKCVVTESSRKEAITPRYQTIR